MEICIARQPVFDRQNQLYGFDLVLRRPGVRGTAGDAPIEQLIIDTMLGIGIDQVAGGRRAFVNVDRTTIVTGAARLLPTDRVVLQLSAPFDDDPELIAACDQLVWHGYRLCVAVDDPRRVPDALLRLADIVKLDVSSIAREALPGLVESLRPYHVRLLASHIRHRLERDTCVELGFELFEGYLFAAAETLVRRDLPIAPALAAQVLEMVRDPRIAGHEIEDVIRRDVALSYKILRMVNCSMHGVNDVWSIGQALRVLGRERLAQWLELLLATSATRDDVRAELVRLALVRGRMCELLADATGVPRAKGPLFLVGMLSVLDQLLETPMESLADSMELADEVRDALLRRADYYGTMLSLVEAYEQGWWDQVGALGASAGVLPTTLAPMYLEALAWAAEPRNVWDAHFRVEQRRMTGSR
jgi:EAL and modified HD-GYP domain-containing signal transduction protein